MRGYRPQFDTDADTVEGRRRKYVAHVSAPYNGWADEDGGSRCHYKNGFLHRDDGPALINRDGREEWYQNGKRWREAEFIAAGDITTKKAISPLRPIKLKNRQGAFQRLH